MSTALRRISIAIGLTAVACGSRDEATAIGSAECAEQLAPLREEMQWVDGRRSYNGRLAAVSEWRRDEIPAHLVAFEFGDVTLDRKPLTALTSVDGKVERELKRALAPLGDQPVALAIEPETQWQLVAPTLRVLSERDSVVRLLVEMPLPPWLDTRLAVEARKDGGSIGDVASVLAQRSDEVFATCPTAQATLAKGSPDMLEYVDAIAACDCRVDAAASRELLHAIATPMTGGVGIVALGFVRNGGGTPFTAKPDARWSEVLPELLAAAPPIVLPDVPPPDMPPPPPANE